MNTPTSGGQTGPTYGSSQGTGQQELREQVQQQVQEKTRQAETKLRDEMDRRTTEYGDQLTSIASAMRRGTDDLRGEGKDQAAQLMDRGAEQIDRAGRYLMDADGDRMLRDVEDFGRRRPGLLAAGGLLLGFAAARFLRASSERRMQGSEWSSPQLVPTEVTYEETLVTESDYAPTATGPAGSGIVAPPTTLPPEVGGA